MSIVLYGKWRLTVSEAIHNWENRFVIVGAATGNGVYPPTIGSSVIADGAAWALRAEYREHGSSEWQASDMQVETQPEQAELKAVIGSEDPLPHRDFEDIQWNAEFLGGTLYDIPYRPFAIRPYDLFSMPDGLFETALGDYYMGVRVVNQWGLPFGNTHVLDISSHSRAELASKGIVINDHWTQAELASVGQQQIGTGMVLGPIIPGQGKTVYFKMNVTNAAPRKHGVEFVLWNTAGMADPLHPLRRVKKNIFVSKTTFDTTTNEFVSEVQQGTLRMRLKQFAMDPVGARKGRKRIRKTPGKRAGTRKLEKLRATLNGILEGKPIDPCVLREILECYCGKACDPGSKPDPNKPTDGRFVYDPFLYYPTKFSYTITPRTPFDGQYGPLPYDDPWWKILLLIIALILLIIGMLEDAGNQAYNDPDLVIGELERWQQDDVDAAVCLLNTDRALGFQQVLDAQGDEEHQNFITALNGIVDLNGPIMTRAELDVLRTLPRDDPQRKLFKSGATTGLTHGIIDGFAPGGHDGATFNIDQLLIADDPAFGESTRAGGDSGSIWVHTESLRPVALHHTGRGTDATASLLEDVFGRLNITL